MQSLSRFAVSKQRSKVQSSRATKNKNLRLDSRTRVICGIILWCQSVLEIFVNSFRQKSNNNAMYDSRRFAVCPTHCWIFSIFRPSGIPNFWREISKISNPTKTLTNLLFLSEIFSNPNFWFGRENSKRSKIVGFSTVCNGRGPANPLCVGTPRGLHSWTWQPAMIHHLRFSSKMRMSELLYNRGRIEKPVALDSKLGVSRLKIISILNIEKTR